MKVVDDVWFTDQLMGPLDGIRKGMKLITIEIPDVEVELYEEKNEGSGYRAFSIPASVVNNCELKTPLVYKDRGVYKIKG